jgi:hypothetical protein
MMIKASQLIEPGCRIAAFGYPDMIANPEQVEALLKGREGLEYHKDSASICARHGKAPRPIPDTYSFFSLLGAKLDVFDVVIERGNEILCDLNYPMDQKESYDIVLDPGTLEHCFNVAQAAFNMAGLLKKNGVIIHQNPFLAGNHGFYSFNPTWYADFYGQDGWKLLDCRICSNERVFQSPLTDRFKFDSTIECGVFAMARREEVKELSFPTQTKYRKMLG